MVIYIGTPFRYALNPHLVGFNEIDKKTREIKIIRGTVSEQAVDVGRNYLVSDMLSKTEDENDVWMFFIDDDVLLPTDVLDLFLKALEENPNTLVFYGDYALKKRTYKSAHCYKNKKVVTVAMGCTFIHKKIFLELIDERVASFGVNPKEDYRWFICDSEKSNVGEDTYFTELLRKIDVKPKLIENLTGIHVDFSKKAAFGPRSLVRNGKIRFDKSYIYSIEKETSPIYFDIIEHEIEVTQHFFKKMSKHGKISVLTPKRFKTTPIISRLYLNDMRGQYNIEMLSILKMPRDKARNFLVQEALDFNSDYIVFLDDDNIVPFDFIQQLLDTNEPIIGLNYSLKKPYYESAHLMSNGKQYPIPTDSKGLVSVNRCFALGASLIKREVFEKIGFPWFQEWTDDNKLESHQTFEDGTKISYTDDAFFTKRAIDAGYTPKVLSNIHSAHIDFQTFRVYGHPDIIDQKTARLKNIVSIKWALSEENNRELIV